MRTWVVLLTDPSGDTVVVATHQLRSFLRRRTLPPVSPPFGWKTLDVMAFPDPERAHAFRRDCGRQGSPLRQVWIFTCRTRAARIFRGRRVADAPLPPRLLPLFIDFASWRQSEPIKSQPFRRFTSAQRPGACLSLVHRPLAVPTQIARPRPVPVLEPA